MSCLQEEIDLPDLNLGGLSSDPHQPQLPFLLHVLYDVFSSLLMSLSWADFLFWIPLLCNRKWVWRDKREKGSGIYLISAQCQTQCGDHFDEIGAIHYLFLPSCPCSKKHSGNHTLAPDLAPWVTRWTKLSQWESFPGIFHTVAMWGLLHSKIGQVMGAMALVKYRKAIWKNKATRVKTDRRGIGNGLPHSSCCPILLSCTPTLHRVSYQSQKIPFYCLNYF